MTTPRDIEMAVQVVAAQLAGDRETVVRVVRDNPQIGDALVALACSLVEELATQIRVTPGDFADYLLLRAAANSHAA